ncbi:serine/threonine kinase [Pelomyxa schiedti]|nr:serine/threonine kinase [Pelomyxa schiedti]
MASTPHRASLPMPITPPSSAFSSPSSSPSPTPLATSPVFQRKKIVIVGGGFAGVSAAKRLEKRSSDQRLFQIFLIDTKDFFENTSAVFKTFADPEATPPQALQVIHTTYLKHTEFVLGEVTKITPSHVVVRVEATMTITLPFDYLILCTGCSYPLAKERNMSQPFRVDWLLKEAQLISSCRSLAIIGGGPTGIELCANIITKYPGKKVTMIHSQKTILERFPEQAQEFVTDFLQRNGVEILLRKSAADLHIKPKTGTPESQGNSDLFDNAGNTFLVKLNTGETLEFDLAYVCAGPVPNTDYAKKHFGHVMDRGRLKVNPYMQLEGYENIFVAGDIANIREEKLAERALAHSRIACKNILSMVKGKAPRAQYKIPKKDPLYILSLGATCAIGIEAGTVVGTGEKMAVMKRSMDTVAHRFLPRAGTGITRPRPRSLSYTDNPNKVSVINVTKKGISLKVTKSLNRFCFTRVCVAPDNFESVEHALSQRSTNFVEIFSFNSLLFEDYMRLLRDVSLAYYDNADSSQPLERLSIFIKAALQCNIQHVVFSYKSCTRDHAGCNFYAEFDEAIRNSTLNYTIVRYDGDFDNIFMKLSKPRIVLQRTLMLPLELNERIFLVDRGDIAKAIAVIFKNPSDHISKEYDLSGTQALSGEEMAAAISMAVLDEVRFIPISEEIATARLQTNARDLPEAMYPCTLCISRKEQSVLRTARSKRELLDSVANQTDSLLTMLIGKPRAFTEWAAHRFAVSAAGFESQTLASLETKGGVSQIISDVAVGGRDLHFEVDPMDLQLGALIGSGAAGKVYKASYFGMPVAVKKLHDDLSSVALEEFKREIGMVCLLRHPNLVECIGAATKCTEKLYIVCELVTRGSLDSLLATSTEPLPFSLQLRFALNVARGVYYLHSANVCHRDLKGSNILVTEAMQLKITDFGTARTVPKDGFAENIGTPQFTAPEVFLKQPFGLPADCYSLGMVLWQIVTRKEPFYDVNRFDVADAVVSGKRPDLPADSPFSTIIAGCWNAAPKKRPTITEMLADLGKLALPQPIPKSSSRRISTLRQLIRDLNPFALESQTLTLTPEILQRIATTLRDPVSGVSMQDHVQEMKTYPRSFTGSDLVDWVLKHNENFTRPEGVSAASWLLLNGNIVHAVPITDAAIEPFHDDSETLYMFP